jgi:surface antigen
MQLKTALVLLMVSALVGCQTGGANQTGGTLIGGATGAVIGSQFGKGHGQLAGVAIGTMLGALVGGSIGKSMDERDRQMAADSAYRALERQPDNSTVTWRNPNNNHAGSMRVTSTQEDSNKVCRDYVQTVTIDGKQELVTGRACRDLRDTKAQWSVQQ